MWGGADGDGAGGSLTSSDTLNLRSRATTFCLKFCCCRRADSQRHTAAPSGGLRVLAGSNEALGCLTTSVVTGVSNRGWEADREDLAQGTREAGGPLLSSPGSLGANAWVTPPPQDLGVARVAGAQWRAQLHLLPVPPWAAGL